MSLDSENIRIKTVNLRNGSLARMEEYVHMKSHLFSRKKIVYLKLFGEVLSVYESDSDNSTLHEWNLRDAVIGSNFWFATKQLSITKRKRTRLFILNNVVEKYYWSQSLQHASHREFTRLYRVKALIAAGEHSRVHEACDSRDDNMKFAVKICKKAGRSFDSVLRLRRQLFIHSVIEHPFIVKAVDLFSTTGYDYIVMQIMRGGNLESLLENNGRSLPESHARMIMKQLFEGLTYLHSKSIVHRNLKPSNILLSSTRFPFSIALCGFQSAAFLNPKRVIDKITHSSAGSSAYRAVEVYNREAYGPFTDMWSAGVILHQMLYGKLPIPGSSPRKLKSKVRGGSSGFDDSIRSVSMEARSLIRQLLQPDPQRRLSALGALCHDWFSLSSSNEEIQRGSAAASALRGDCDKLKRRFSSPETRRDVPIAPFIKHVARRGLRRVCSEKPGSFECIMRSATARRQLRVVFRHRRKFAIAIIVMIAVFRMRSYAQKESLTRYVCKHGSDNAENVINAVNRRGSRDTPTGSSIQSRRRGSGSKST